MDAQNDAVSTAQVYSTASLRLAPVIVSLREPFSNSPGGLRRSAYELVRIVEMLA